LIKKIEKIFLLLRYFIRMSHFTKTTNGALAVNADSVSTWVGIWLVMANTPADRIVSLITKAINENLDKPEQLARLLVLVARLRDIRNGGQGRRSESMTALMTALPLINDTRVIEVMLDLWASHYGRWDDLNDIRDGLVKMTFSLVSSEMKMFILDFIYQKWAHTIKSNVFSKETIGAWKYFPKEKTDCAARVKIGQILFPTITQDTVWHGIEVTERSPLHMKWHRVLKSVRFLLKTNRMKIQMVESFLCSDNADKIDPGKVPGIARKVLSRALENKASLRSKKGDVERTSNPNRVKCAENFRVHAQQVIEARQAHQRKMDELRSQLASSNLSVEAKALLQTQIEEETKKFEETAPKVHGGDTVFVHDLVKQYYNEGCRAVNPMIEAQFGAIMDGMKLLAENNILVVPDTSGSMTSYNGVPRNVATGLSAIFASSLPKALRHKCISFSSRPSVFDLSKINGGNPTLFDYIKYFDTHSIIENTNIKSTIDLISQLMAGQDFKLDMILFITDTQFDGITTDRSFTAGEYCKKKLPDTLVGFWNVNGVYTETLPAEPSENGVIMVSGFNAKMLESILDTVKAASEISFEDLKVQREAARRAFEENRMQEMLRLQEEQRRAEEERQLNTYQMILDFCEGAFSYPIRRKLCSLDSGIFAEYNFVEPVSEDA
jgi:hypothetical protein